MFLGRLPHDANALTLVLTAGEGLAQGSSLKSPFVLD